MAVRVAINGFGRMGRLALRVAFDRPDFEIVQINETKGGAATAAHLLEFDSVHGRWRRDISAQGDGIVIDGKRTGFSEYADPSKAPWKDLGIDIAVECSGKFKTAESLAPYFAAGVKKVIVAAPVKSGALNIVMGCNDGLYDAE
jgi:glyceraldehyde 3-phosphate dehydrogenase